ncbi:MAG: glutamate--cysteine ligase [Pseudomonadota bacterium]
MLKEGLKGIEKESLRITRGGIIAQTPHARALGSALTNRFITTDYSEALLEFITPAFTDSVQTLSFLENIHQFVYDNMPDELLLATSMPCGIAGDESIPIAQYGSSNIGRMKHIYRLGLAYRYGRAMQSIAGIHFNYSVPADLWPVLQEMEEDRQPLQTYIADAYFGLIRNLQRRAWLVLYLFGASPAICKSFLTGREHLNAGFEDFDDYTLYRPYATSLRMSDIGYRSSTQAQLKISFNNLNEYVASLTQAIKSPYPDYEAIGVNVDGAYRQLNSNILQIENEYYSPVRPKQIAESGEKPTLALCRRGVRYVEVRSLDVGLFEPVGISIEQARFMEALLLTCLLHESPRAGPGEQDENTNNLLATAYAGRQPDLKLQRYGQSVSLREWALEILDAMEDVCDILDDDAPEKPFTRALSAQIEAVNYPETTPSARILNEMRRLGEPFSPYALHISNQHEKYFRSHRLDPENTAYFRQEADSSIEHQHEIEAADTLPFDEFLQRYLSQT